MSSEETKISIEEFLDVGLAALLPQNPHTKKPFTVGYRRAGCSILVNEKGGKSKTYTGNFPKKDLITIEREKESNQFHLPPLKKVLQQDRIYYIHAQCIPNLVVFDYDEDGNINNPLIPDVLRTLPYTISMSGKGFHFYARCDDLPELGEDDRVCDRSGFPARHVGCLVNLQGKSAEEWGREEKGTKKMKCAFGDLFTNNHKFKTDPKTGETTPFNIGINERASGKETTHYAYNWQGSIPTISFADFEQYLDPEFVWKEDKKVDEKAREKKAADRKEKWKPMADTEDMDLKRGFTANCVMWMLEHISPDREIGEGWMQIGTFLKFKCDDAENFCEYPIFEDAFEVFDTWSKGGKNYIASKIRQHWDSFSEDVINFGSLVVFAKQDAGDLVVKDYLKDRFSTAASSMKADYSETGLAYILRYHLHACMCDTKQKDGKKKMYQCKNGGVWHSIDDTTVNNILLNVVLPEIELVRRELYELKSQYEDAEDEDNLNIVESRIKTLNMTIERLKTHKFRQTVFDSLCDIEAYKPDDGVPLYRKWDDDETMRYIFPFNNICYFLREDRWGDIEPEKFCKYTTGYSWPLDPEGKPIMPPQEDLDYVFNNVSNMFLDENQMRYIMTLFSANMEGENVFREVYFVTGGGDRAQSGGNGKGLLFDLVGSAFGTDTGGDAGFCGQMNPAMFQTAKKGGGPEPELANHSKRRIMSTSEPQNKPWLSAELKRMVDEVVPCRKLFSGDDSFNAKFPGFHQCNDTPSMDVMDGGMLRRMMYIELPFKFVDAGQTTPGHHLYNPDLDSRVCKTGDRELKTNAKTRRYGRAFFIILIRHYQLYVKDKLTGPGVKTPASVTITDEKGNMIFPRDWTAARSNYIDAADVLKKIILDSYVIHPELEKEWEDGSLTKGQGLTAKMKKMYRSESDWYSSRIETSVIYEKYLADFESGSGYKKKEGDIKAKLKEMGLYLDGDDVRGLQKISGSANLDKDKAFEYDAEDLDDKSYIINAKEIDGVPINKIPFAKGPDSYLASLGYGQVVAQEPAPQPKKRIVVPSTPKLSVAEKIKKEVENTSPRDIPDAGVGTGLSLGVETEEEEEVEEEGDEDEEEDEEEEEDDNGSVLADSEEEEERQIKKLMDELA